MVTVQFKAKIKNGVIQIPRKYQGKFNTNVRVILKVESKKSTASNYLDQLMAHPVKVTNFKSLARDQIYAR